MALNRNAVLNQKAPMDRNAKIGIGVVIGVVGACICLCLCAVLGFIVFGGGLVNRVMVQDPEEAHSIGAEILNYQLPQGYHELAAMNVLTVKMVMIGEAESLEKAPASLENMILISQVASPELMEDPQLREQLQRSLEMNFRGTFQGGNVDWELVDTSPITIRGQEINASTYEGVRSDGVAVRQVITDVFAGNGGATFIIIMGTVENWPKEDFDAFLGSIN